MTIVYQPYFRNEQAALAKLESLVWPQGPICVHCGAAERIGAVVGKGARPGLRFCCACRKQFRVTMGTIFEGSHVPLHKWFQACFLLTASRAGISPHQLHLKLQITNKTALCMVHRLADSTRAAMRAEGSQAAGGELVVFPRTRWRRRSLSADRAQSLGSDREAATKNGPLWAAPPPGVTRQFLAFIDAARELDCAEDESRFERAVFRLACAGVRGRRRPVALAAAAKQA